MSTIIQVTRYSGHGLSHFHDTFTLPGSVTRALLERRFQCKDLITAAAGVCWKELLKSAGNPENYRLPDTVVMNSEGLIIFIE